MKPTYPHQPVAKLDSLALALGLTHSELIELASVANSMYFVTRVIEKPDGSKRITHDVKARLKRVHERINSVFLKQVSYPSYLQGSLKGRDYLSNTKQHINKHIIISEDISNFYPSISNKVVHEVWVGCFGFSNEVASCLTALVTHNGHLVQGGKTSSYISNLVLWSRESKLVEELKRKGTTYTRYVDDVTVSSPRPLSKSEITNAISSVYGLFKTINVKPNRTKHEVMSKGKRQTVHRVNVSAGRPTFSKKERSKIKTAVFQCEQLFPKASTTQEYLSMYRSALGRVNTLARLHKKEADSLKERLKAIQPFM
ncbi:TPA: RNA-directed DNA polymerase [Vibrio vulnificus]|nr:RNA-directed DNA polymerase [Vibrio vulnificus]HDY7574034.1 RNA-directed DNA polymerase [Vibrio vulnificus]